MAGQLLDWCWTGAGPVLDWWLDRVGLVEAVLTRRDEQRGVSLSPAESWSPVRDGTGSPTAVAETVTAGRYLIGIGSLVWWCRWDGTGSAGFCDPLGGGVLGRVGMVRGMATSFSGRVRRRLVWLVERDRRGGLEVGLDSPLPLPGVAARFGPERVAVEAAVVEAVEDGLVVVPTPDDVGVRLVGMIAPGGRVVLVEYELADVRVAEDVLVDGGFEPFGGWGGWRRVRWSGVAAA